MGEPADVPLARRLARLALPLALAWAGLAPLSSASADALDRVRSSHRLAFGADEEGGAPYFFKDDDERRVGFEADLMAAIGRDLGVEPEFRQGQWEYLLQVLGRGAVDAVVNGYELTAARSRDYLATRPYYVYQLQVMARRDGPIRSRADFERPRPGGGPWKLGVMGMSAADAYAQKFQAANVRVYNFDGATNAMRAVRNGQIDATLQDLPAARHYLKSPEFRDDLALAGPPEGCGYYVIYTRKADARLRDALDASIGRLVDSGELRAIDEKYGLWNEAQEALKAPGPAEPGPEGPARPLFDLGLLRRFGPSLLLAALTTLVLSCTAMPLAMALGLVVAVGRVFGPAPLAKAFSIYVETVRGTPLIIQLYALFYVLPELGVTLTPWAAGVAGLAINYSAYEAEIYRSGLQAVPAGQMEAALALGMSRPLAIRRVIVPQALRIVIPPVTGDFIALFKDTSVCSVITLTELTKQYSILFNGQGGVVEFGLATAALYMAMSLPLSWLSRGLERRLDGGERGGGDPMIEVDGLFKRHGELEVLNGVTLRVGPGEVAAIVGPSGGGKSTFLRCLNGLESFQGGSVTVDGLTIAAGTPARERSKTLRRVRLRLGMVFQGFNLFPHRTVLENVTEAPTRVLGLDRAEAEGRARRLLDRVGLLEKLDARPGQLSGGQQQRVAIARALAMEPRAILFDEPTSALDPRMTAEVLAVMADLARDGLTMVVVTHAMRFARQVAHTVHVFEGGRVLESGPPAQVFDAPRHETTRRLLSEDRAA